MKMTETPERLVSKFIQLAKKRTELGEELNKGNGWNDLVSLGCTQKHWIHDIVDRSTKLQELFETVSTPPGSSLFRFHSSDKGPALPVEKTLKRDILSQL